MSSFEYINIYWENPSSQRYYQLYLEQDLFADWVLIKLWGRRGTKLGGKQQVVCQTYEQALQLIDQIKNIRKRRGYMLCAGNN